MSLPGLHCCQRHTNTVLKKPRATNHRCRKRQMSGGCSCSRHRSHRGGEQKITFSLTSPWTKDEPAWLQRVAVPLRELDKRWGRAEEARREKGKWTRPADDPNTGAARREAKNVTCRTPPTRSLALSVCLSLALTAASDCKQKDGQTESRSRVTVGASTHRKSRGGGGAGPRTSGKQKCAFAP